MWLQAEPGARFVTHGRRWRGCLAILWSFPRNSPGLRAGSCSAVVVFLLAFIRLLRSSLRYLPMSLVRPRAIPLVSVVVLSAVVLLLTHATEVTAYVRAYTEGVRAGADHAPRRTKDAIAAYWQAAATITSAWKSSW